MRLYPEWLRGGRGLRFDEYGELRRWSVDDLEGFWRSIEGNPHAAIDDVAHSLQPLLDMYEHDEAGGETDMPYPPDYPKMPGEPKRVQPSRDRDRPRD